MELESAWVQAITFAIAVLGAILGVMNTWRAMNDARVKLRVQPAHAIAPGSQGVNFSIQVTNLSRFPLTIREVGLTLDGRSIRSGGRAAIPDPVILDGGPWPRRLDARDAVSVYFDVGQLRGVQGRVGRAYARTACDEVAYGSSPALRQVRNTV